MHEKDWIESRLRAARLRPTLVRRHRRLIERDAPVNLGAEGGR
jgi:hypothetical protein